MVSRRHASWSICGDPCITLTVKRAPHCPCRTVVLNDWNLPENKFIETQCDFTNFSKQFSAGAHNFRFRSRYSKFVKLLYALVWAITFTTFFPGLGAIPTKLSQRKEKCANSKNLYQARQNFYGQSLSYMSRRVFTCWLSEFETYWAIYWWVQWTNLPNQKDRSLSNTKQETPIGYW